MKELGVFITTHLSKGYRHTGRMEDMMFDYYKDTVLKNYEELDSGLDIQDWDLIIANTGSTHPGFNDMVKDKIATMGNLSCMVTSNNCGFVAAMKHVMHNQSDLMDAYKYYFFHVDDAVEPVGYGWATSLIREYNLALNPGVMGRFADTIRLSENGLVDHRNCCPHIAKIWGITEMETIPHLHGDWFFMDAETLQALSKVWYSYQSDDTEAMDWQKEWENKDFRYLADIGDGRKTIDNVHIGREVDFSLRVTKDLGKDIITYTGNKIHVKPLYKR